MLANNKPMKVNSLGRILGRDDLARNRLATANAASSCDFTRCNAKEESNMEPRTVLEEAATQRNRQQVSSAQRRPHFLNANDGTKLFVLDWGSGPPIVLLSPWTLNSDIWGTHIAALTARGFRCVALDRRGHGRSDIPTGGYDLDTLADDVASVIEQLDLQQAILVAYSMGASEAVRYLERHGSSRISRLVPLCAGNAIFAPNGGQPRRHSDLDGRSTVQRSRARFPQMDCRQRGSLLSTGHDSGNARLDQIDDDERSASGRTGDAHSSRSPFCC